MQSLLKKSFAGILLLALLSSFAYRPGGEGFEIYADGQLLLQRFGGDVNQVQSVSIAGQPTENLFIKYFHCGKSGTSRLITVKDNRDNLIGSFPYADSKAAQNVMKLPVASLKTLVKGNSTVHLYYTSAELKSGRLLATISL